MQFKNTIFLFLVFALVLTACSKEEENISQQERETFEKAAQDFLLADNIFETVLKMVDAEARQQADLNGFQAPGNEVEIRDNCPGVNLDLTENSLFPATLTLDFADGCNPNGGPLISGQVTAVFDGLLLNPGSSYQLTFTNFIYDGQTVEGSYRLSNDGEDSNGYRTLSASIDGSITTTEGRTIEFQSLTLRKQTEGGDTDFFSDGLEGIFDDVWSITREASIQTSDGDRLAIITPSAIRIPLLCRWPVSGYYQLDLNSQNLTGSIDFGDGSCDNKALLTIGDYSREIEL